MELLKYICYSIPCLVVGIPVALAMLLLSTSTPKALLGENDVPGIPKIFMAFSGSFLFKSIIGSFCGKSTRNK